MGFQQMAGANGEELAAAWLKDKGYVDFTIEELSGAKRWAITEAGKSKL